MRKILPIARWWGEGRGNLRTEWRRRRRAPPVRCEVVRLKTVELQERAEEAARRQPQATHKVRAEDDPLALLRRGGNLPLRRMTHPHVILAGEPTSPAEELDMVVVNFGAVPSAGAHRGRRGGRGRAHRELIAAAFVGAWARGGAKKKKKEESEEQ